MRNITAKTIAPLLAITGYRFSKAWRHGETVFKGFIYEHLISTVVANSEADKIISK